MGRQIQISHRFSVLYQIRFHKIRTVIFHNDRLDTFGIFIILYHTGQGNLLIHLMLGNISTHKAVTNVLIVCECRRLIAKGGHSDHSNRNHDTDNQQQAEQLNQTDIFLRTPSLDMLIIRMSTLFHAQAQILRIGMIIAVLPYTLTVIDALLLFFKHATLRFFRISRGTILCGIIQRILLTGSFVVYLCFPSANRTIFIIALISAILTNPFSTHPRYPLSLSKAYAIACAYSMQTL